MAVHLFWGLSALGAALFFAAGLVAGAIRRRERELAWAAERATLEAERADLERRVAEKAVKYTRLRAQARDAELRTEGELARLRERLDAAERKSHDDVNVALPPVTHTGASGTTFQAILERIAPCDGLRSAVLGDGLGLPIASVGEDPEPLAGFCGFLAQAATKAKDFLPLGNIRRIVVEDDSRATLTACNLPGCEIFVATLTAGPGPELARMVQVLNDASSFLVERNPS